MSNGPICIFAFSLGLAVGSVIAWKMLKTKYEKIAQEEIDSVKEVFSRRKSEPKEEHDIVTEEQKDISAAKPGMKKYSSMLHSLSYVDDGKEVADVKKPYVISPDESGELDEYDVVSLNYYADDVLTDDWDNPIEDIEDTVGEDSLHHFGEYEDDCVCVRNEKYKVDYEICRDLRCYSDVILSDSHPVDTE